MNSRRALRWTLFWTAALAFIRFVLADQDDLIALGIFILAGGAWYWLERRKMRELDALIKR